MMIAPNENLHATNSFITQGNVNSHHSEFNPYADNGGYLYLHNNLYISSILAIAGPDFCIVAADTRQSNGYLINCRTSPKAFKLADNAVLATSGFHADGMEFFRVISTKLKVIHFLNNDLLDV